MKIYAAVLVALFGLFAWFQFNDPDPLIWVSFYGMLALLAGLKLAERLKNVYRWFAMGVCTVLLVQTFPGLWDYFTNQEGYTITEVMSNDKPWIELSREFGGALIGLLAILFLKKDKA
ncbi:MAG: transmembrane 220 family protein [Bacteroidia bacterium]